MHLRPARLGILILAFIAAVTLALLSSNTERIGPELVQDGNVCGPGGNDPCYKPALKGGFPLAYLFDQPGISVEGRLFFFEDTLYIGPLMFDIAVYFAAILPGLRRASRSPAARARD